ncbi:MAG TPA: polyhydroxyalkanoate synthesis repressor PhaR, partial [Alphaproteobacteria bacterium]
DTGRSSYVTLDDLCEMIKEGHDFVVYDAKSGEDLTRSVLTQIIVEQETHGENLLPVSFLKQLIGFYGDNLQSLVPNYLEQTFAAFTKNQEQFRDQFGKSMGGMMPNMMNPGAMMNPMAAMEDMVKKNMEMFQNTMKAFTSPVSAGKTGDSKSRVDELKSTMAAMQREIDRLSGRG